METQLGKNMTNETENEIIEPSILNLKPKPKPLIGCQEGSAEIMNLDGFNYEKMEMLSLVLTA